MVDHTRRELTDENIARIAGTYHAWRDDVGATTRVAPTVGGWSVGDVVGAFKSRTTVSYTRGVRRSAWPAFRGRLWPRNYYEHVTRNDQSLHRTREYIVNNPLQWDLDRENPRVEVARHGVPRRLDEPWRD